MYTSRIRRTLAIAAAIAALTLPTLAHAVKLPESLAEAVKRGRAQEKARATAPYFGQFLYRFFESKYSPVVKRCFNETPDARPFTFVVAIDADGKVLRIYRDVETAIYTCLSKELEKEVFLLPPTSPIFFAVDMSFE